MKSKEIIKQLLPPLVLEVRRSIIKRRTPQNGIERPKFSNTWFAQVTENWDHLLSQLKPSKVLEIGSWEGASTCYLIEKLGAGSDGEIHCIDTWEGGIEHENDMRLVEQTFARNTQLAMSKVPGKVSLITHKSRSDLALSRLISDGKSDYFDLIYVDGSHQAPDVLFDAVAGFKLLKIGGIMAFDDYLWQERLPQGTDLIRCPKPAIDTFVNLNIRKLTVLKAPLGQLFVQKTSN